jgi:hypothetical protein
MSGKGKRFPTRFKQQGLSHPAAYEIILHGRSIF